MDAIARHILIIAIVCGFLAASSPMKAAGKPGKFDYYVLVLSWSPSFCAGEGRAKKSPQCSGTRPFAFVLHGLWPQYETGWPNDCHKGSKPRVPSALINTMLDIMPARGLVIHQYKKHGTCSGLDPESYFQTARKAFEAIKIPARYLQPQKPVIISPRVGGRALLNCFASNSRGRAIMRPQSGRALPLKVLSAVRRHASFRPRKCRSACAPVYVRPCVRCVWSCRTRDTHRSRAARHGR